MLVAFFFTTMLKLSADPNLDRKKNRFFFCHRQVFKLLNCKKSACSWKSTIPSTIISVLEGHRTLIVVQSNEIFAEIGNLIHLFILLMPNYFNIFLVYRYSTVSFYNPFRLYFEWQSPIIVYYIFICCLFVYLVVIVVVERFFFLVRSSLLLQQLR